MADLTTGFLFGFITGFIFNEFLRKRKNEQLGKGMFNDYEKKNRKRTQK